MSEYWVSRKKYFCRYCEIYIADDAPSRQQHESGLRHKGNKDRFVRGLYKQGERRKKDLEEEKREMAAIDTAANAAYARDVSTGHASLGSSSKSSPAPTSASSSSRKPDKPATPFTNYSTAQSLGYSDPDAERVAAEAERRRTQGVVGEWETVVPGPSSLQMMSETSEAHTFEAGPSQKREAQDDAEEDDERRFKVRKKTLAVGLGDIWDPSSVPIKLKSDKLKKEDLDADTLLVKSEDNVNGYTASAAPKWTARGWKRAGEPVGADVDISAEASAKARVARPMLSSSDEQAVNNASLSATCTPKGDSTTEDAAMIKHEMSGVHRTPSGAELPPPITEEWQHESCFNGNVKKETDSIGPSDLDGTATPKFRKRKIPTGHTASSGRR